MTTQQIIEAARTRSGIDRLNDMQQAMAAVAIPGKVLLTAPTGSGKTLAFSIPFLASIPDGVKGVKGVVMAPTRELALQIYETLRVLGGESIKTTICYGGHPMSAETASLAAAPDVVVGTPGRLVDHLQRGSIDLRHARSLVIDEYDKALELGFLPQMKKVVAALPPLDTLILTSATAAAELPEFIDTGNIVRLDFSTGSGAPESHTEILHLHSEAPDKLEALTALLRTLKGRSIVFVNHRDAAGRVVTGVRKAGIRAVLYSGALDQEQRERALILFENLTVPVMVATDLAARGLDIQGVENVIHYHLPPTAENWTHRNGRTARQGANGRVVVITSPHDTPASYISWDAELTLPADPGKAPKATMATLYFDAGRKEKISRGDIAGFLMAHSGLDRTQIGRIDVRDHCAYAAVDASMAYAAVQACQGFKIKNKKVRISVLKV